MPSPQRIQLSRRKGVRLHDLSLALNGLPAVKVDRATWLGNPFTVGNMFTAAEAVEHFRDLMMTPANLHRAIPKIVAASGLDRRTIVSGLTARQMEIRSRIRDLVGHNVACWCEPKEPCHGDVLLEICSEWYDRGVAHG